MALSVQETKREDGLWVVTKTLPLHVEEVRIAVVCLAGSAYDPPGLEGLFHILEHGGLLGGTKHRPPSEVADEMERCFTDFNAETHLLHTVYWGETVPRYSDSACSILFDMYLYPLLGARDVAREREVLLNEFADFSQDDTETARIAHSELLWRENPLKRPAVGTAESILSINRQLLLDTLHEWHIPSSTVIIGTGSVDHDALVEKAFVTFPFNNTQTKLLTWGDECDELPAKGQVAIRRAGRALGTVAIGCKIPFLSGRDEAAFLILRNMLARALFKEIRHEKRFTYHIWCEESGYQRTGGHFYSIALMLPKRIGQVKKLMLEILCSRPLDKRCFSIVKEGLCDRFLASFSTLKNWEGAVLDRVLNYGRIGLDGALFLHDLQRNMSETLSSIEFDEVVAMRERFFLPERFACAIVKPV